MIYELLAPVQFKWFIGNVGKGFNEHRLPLRNHSCFIHTFVITDLSTGGPSKVMVSIKQPLQRLLM